MPSWQDYKDPGQLALVRAVVTTPEDDTPRLVYADWLEEHGQRDRAEYVRLAVENQRTRINPTCCMRPAHWYERKGGPEFDLEKVYIMDPGRPLAGLPDRGRLPPPEERRGRHGLAVVGRRQGGQGARPARCTRADMNYLDDPDWHALVRKVQERIRLGSLRLAYGKDYDHRG